MALRSVSVPIREDDGPFSYVYLAMAAVPGMGPAGRDVPQVHLESFPDNNAEAFLTMDWDAYGQHMDRSNALAFLMLTGFLGQPKWRSLSRLAQRVRTCVLGPDATFRRNLKREALVARQQRHKAYGTSGCYLIYRGEGDLLEPMHLEAARRCGNTGFGIDVIRKEPYRTLHSRAFHSAATALSLTLANTNGSPDIEFVGDLLYLKGKDDFVLYPRNLEMGTVSVMITSPLDSQVISDAQQYIPAMLSDNRVEVAVSLFVQSQKKGNDNLRSFIAAWSALELLVNRLSKVVWLAWHKLLETAAVPSWDKDLRNIPTEEYRLRDRFLSVACVLDWTAASSDADTFVRVNHMRSGFYHRMEVQEKDLPTSDVQTLFRKYLRLGLAYQSDA